MSSDELTEFFVHEVHVDTYLGTTGRSVEKYADTVMVPCLLSRRLRYVRAANGDQVPSQASLSCDVVWAGTFKPGSKVIVDGRRTTVISEQVSDAAPLIDGISRVRAYLQ